MNAPKDVEIWRQIPPEEKIELMSRAHSKGILVAFITIIICCTLAVGFRFSPLMWASIIGAPFVFQIVAGTSWKSLRPMVMLEYLAARSVARRYAFSVNSRELEPNFVFKAELEEEFPQERMQEALADAVDKTLEAAVWVALFNDAVVMMSEAPGGAQLRLAHKLDTELSVQGRSTDGSSEYSSAREVWLSFPEKKVGERRFKLTSKYPAALIVFEKKIQALQKEEVQRIQERINLLSAPEDLAPPELQL